MIANLSAGTQKAPPATPSQLRCGNEAAVVVDIAIESPAWSAEPDVETVVRRAIGAAAEAKPDACGEVSVVLADDAAIRILNRDWRKLDKPTNVLSFPAPQVGGNGVPALLGDIVIAYETTASEAAADGKPFSHHLAHLAVHGFLHLLGYDHELEDAAVDMEGFETKILAALDIPDPYLTRDGLDPDHHA